MMASSPHQQHQPLVCTCVTALLRSVVWWAFNDVSEVLHGPVITAVILRPEFGT
jgi:hypothetical protein